MQSAAALKLENSSLSSSLVALDITGTELERNTKLREIKRARMEELKGLGEAIGKLWSEVRRDATRYGWCSLL